MSGGFGHRFYISREAQGWRSADTSAKARSTNSKAQLETRNCRVLPSKSNTPDALQVAILAGYAHRARDRHPASSFRARRGHPDWQARLLPAPSSAKGRPPQSRNGLPWEVSRRAPADSSRRVHIARAAAGRGLSISNLYAREFLRGRDLPGL